ncbi:MULTISPECIES: hypothetical protein [unclassified Mesorhizobium]|jgi:hypothetical protein|uniref:hypothetical protein n=1 Tax=unclassified Mesorhizobium TaxID=325217 RepID=UPI00086E0332|nr:MULTISPECIES: hypothetical protein [unclassified Mesorhizobium]MBN9253420.1 hypothetical protein [Mesorhizobium sp.]MBN9272915.1 hypothetical protein [Mesorhizobium sp.]ODT19997.1 MAG: hypothetical protein ABS57_02425 [Mesorhizobium sp. SCN 65-12]OJX82132.1 MAG: hypothetical protein BGO93_23250 [Mesorhizobium sp. 65-26]
MKKLLLASMIAVASATAMIVPANAGVTIGIGTGYDDGYYGDDYYRDDYGPYYPHRYYRHVYNDDDYGGGYMMRHRHHCRTEWVTHWRHHHRVVERVRVCG